MDRNARLFMISGVLVLFIAKLWFLFAVVGGPVVFPDECAYSSPSLNGIGDLMNLSLYSFLSFQGRAVALIANSFTTSLIFIVAFLIFRESENEKRAALLAVMSSFFPPLWTYSFLDMTEAMLLLFGVLAFYRVGRKGWGVLSVLTKPLGAAVLAANYRIPGLLACAVLGIIGAFAMNLPGGSIINALECWLRAGLYILFASFGLAAVPFLKLMRGESLSGREVFFAWLCGCMFSLLLAPSFIIWAPKFYGRYFDLLALLALFFVAREYRGKALPGALILWIASIVLWLALFGNSWNLVLDSGAGWVGSALNGLRQVFAAPRGGC